ncbi:MAG TPA: hypothetical protein VMM12_12660 [Longimicrobiales bacterium]|nr:hypothetical protein [Longimicrobiales bacterium]
MRRLLAILAAAASLSAAPLAAQARPPLSDVLDNLADLWARGDAGAIAGLTSASGVDIEIAGVAMGSISGRKLSAALRRIFDERVTVSVVSRMTSPVQGVEDRAFGELSWRVRLGGATVAESTTVFLALIHEPVGWRVTQIRILE